MIRGIRRRVVAVRVRTRRAGSNNRHHLAIANRVPLRIADAIHRRAGRGRTRPAHNDVSIRAGRRRPVQLDLRVRQRRRRQRAIRRRLRRKRVAARRIPACGIDVVVQRGIRAVVLKHAHMIFRRRRQPGQRERAGPAMNQLIAIAQIRRAREVIVLARNRHPIRRRPGNRAALPHHYNPAEAVARRERNRIARVRQRPERDGRRLSRLQRQRIAICVGRIARAIILCAVRPVKGIRAHIIERAWRQPRHRHARAGIRINHMAA